jgi:hypothetical protein
MIWLPSKNNMIFEQYLFAKEKNIEKIQNLEGVIDNIVATTVLIKLLSGTYFAHLHCTLSFKIRRGIGERV